MAGAGGGGKELFSSEDSARWRASLDSYDQVLTLLASSKKRGGSSSSLKLLDKWYQKELPASVTSRSQPHLTHEELCQLMQWKLARGKFRPRLMEMVRQNSPEDVEKVTGSAIGALPDLERAVRLASQLRAVGPATASGSRDVPFMADEAAASVVPSLGRLTYSLKQYLTYARLLQEKASRLNSGDGEMVWSAHDVELALWSNHLSTRLPQDTQSSLLGKRATAPQPSTNSRKKAKLSADSSP